VLYAANLALANLGNADLSNANLHHADLKEANVQFTNFAGAVGLSKEEKEDLKKRGAKVD
ncbi:MAG: pentapeptide repeat-containing protein, partial [Candidatus Brocadiales bacterium]